MTGPYGRWIPDYRDGGLHPFPVDGKRPCVTSWAGRRPSAATTEKWARAFPTANLGLPTKRERLAVLDADDAEAVALFEAEAGFTPLRVETRRGEHWYFGDPRGEIAGANHPLGQPFDIKAAGTGALVLIPGSENQGVIYRIVDYDGEDHAAEFARRIRNLPALAPAARRALLQESRGLVQVRKPTLATHNTVRLIGATIPEGVRNETLFKAACAVAHDLRRRHGDGEEGRTALDDHTSALNSALCDPPLPSAEVSRLADGVWARTLSGVNRPPLRKRRYVADVLKRGGKQVRSLVLWAWMSQSGLDPRDIELAPARVAAAIPGWRPHDAMAAIRGLVALQVLRPVTAGSRGRGNAAHYRLTEPLVTRLDIAAALQVLGRDARAVALMMFVTDYWGGEAQAHLSALGMSQAVGGPFGGWTKVGIVKARDHLESAGLLERIPQKRRGLRQARALFQVRAAGVLKIAENVPVDIHPPLGLGTSSAPAREAS